jgi:hypothetical protein
MMSRVVRIGDYESAPDAKAAEWVPKGLRGFGETVLSVVPDGYEAYARIFHHAYRDDPPSRVLWRDVATGNGRISHRAMQWPSIVGSRHFADGASQPGLWDTEPLKGSLPEELVPPVIAVLARHTATPEHCWYAVWDGFGCLALRDGEAPVFQLPHRRMFLLTGPITAVRGSLCVAPWWQSPNLWWPEDKAWCIATEIDLWSTYVGGRRRCVDDLVNNEQLEAVAVRPSDRITWSSDRLNPSPWANG